MVITTAQSLFNHVWNMNREFPDLSQYGIFMMSAQRKLQLAEYRYAKRELLTEAREESTGYCKIST